MMYFGIKIFRHELTGVLLCPKMITPKSNVIQICYFFNIAMFFSLVSENLKIWIIIIIFCHIIFTLSMAFDKLNRVLYVKHSSYLLFTHLVF